MKTDIIYHERGDSRHIPSCLISVSIDIARLFIVASRCLRVFFNGKCREARDVLGV